MIPTNSVFPGTSAPGQNVPGFGPNGTGLPEVARGPLDTGKGRETTPGQNRAEEGNQQDRVSLGNTVQSRYDTPEQVLKNFDPQAVVDNVSSVIERALERAAAQGASEEELQSMREAAQSGIDRGFSDAQDIIKGLGLMSEELQGVIGEARNGISSRLDDFSAGLADLVSAQATEQVQGSRMAAARSQQDSFSFSVTTAEGDVVTINAARSESQALEMVQSQGENARELAARWQDERGEQFSFSVQGSLSAEETEAIEELMAQVGRVADKFYSGNYEAAFNKAERLDVDGDTLVSMSLSMTQKTVAAAQYSNMASGEASLPGRAASDWIMPVKQYAQALGELQGSQSDLLGDKAWLEMLEAHPKQKQSMVDFAQNMLERLNS